jgi:hypothetical protein
MSSTRHAVVRSPSLTGWGNLPDFTPCHHVDFPTGISGSTGGFAFLSPTICQILKKPLSCNVCIDIAPSYKNYGAKRKGFELFARRYSKNFLAVSFPNFWKTQAYFLYRVFQK